MVERGWLDADELEAIEDLEAFHPDALFDRLSLFQEARSLRKRLADPASFAAARSAARNSSLRLLAELNEEHRRSHPRESE